MKKIVSLMLVLCVICTCSITAFGATITESNESTTEMTVTYGVSTSYTVTIPDSVTITDSASSATITVNNALLPSNATLKVFMQYDGTLTDVEYAENVLTYYANASGNVAKENVQNDDVILSTTSNQNAETTLSFYLNQPVTIAGKYNDTLTFIVDIYGPVLTIEQLQKQYTFQYYSTMNLAVADVNDGTIGANADAEKDNAVAGIYVDENDMPVVVLLQDTTETNAINLLADMTINLGGNTLSFASDVGFVGSAETAYDIAINGKLSNSKMEITDTTDTTDFGYLIQTGVCNFTLTGGTYNSDGTLIRGVLVNTNGTLSATDCIITTNTTGNAVSVYGEDDSNIELTNCKVMASSESGQALATYISGSATINDCNLVAETISKQASTIYLSESENTTINNCDITAISSEHKAVGVADIKSSNIVINSSNMIGHSAYLYNGAPGWGLLQNNGGTAILNNCYTFGTHSGIQTAGNLNINGGTYESYAHGGLYFCGANTTSYIRNATLRECELPSGYDSNVYSNGAGFYMRSLEGNMTVYMDNCDIYGSRVNIAMANRNEAINTLYISNSNINLDATIHGIRIDSDAHKLYIGTGCNFTAENTTLPEAVVTTGDVYNP